MTRTQTFARMAVFASALSTCPAIADDGTIGNWAPSWKSYMQTGNKSDIVSSPEVAAAIGTKANAVGGFLQNPTINQRAITTAPLQSSDVGAASGVAGLNAQSQVTNPLSGPAYGYVMYNNDPTAANLAMPTIQCSGNGARGQPSAYGAVCINLYSNPDNETYSIQSRILNTTQPVSGKTQDVVAGYFGVDTTALSVQSWALNGLINDNLDGGGFGAGVLELDANNINCDNPDPEGNYYTGLASGSIRKTRSDGSACPAHRGMTIGGIAGHTGNSGILIANSPMTNGANQFEDGIDMIGSTVIGANEIYSETVAQNNIKWKGTHTRAIDDRDATNNYAFASLPNNVGGRIMWECPDNAPASCVNGGVVSPWYTGVQLTGGMSEFKGQDSQHQFGIGFTLSSPGGVVAASADTVTGVLPTSTGSYDFSFTDGTTSNVAMRVKSGYITLNAVPTLPVLTTTAIKALTNVPSGAIVMDQDTKTPAVYYQGSWYPVQLGSAL